MFLYLCYNIGFKFHRYFIKVIERQKYHSKKIIHSDNNENKKYFDYKFIILQLFIISMLVFPLFIDMK